MDLFDSEQFAKAWKSVGETEKRQPCKNSVVQAANSQRVMDQVRIPDISHIPRVFEKGISK